MILKDDWAKTGELKRCRIFYSVASIYELEDLFKRLPPARWNVITVRTV